MIQKDIKITGAEILILGITFKENCPDVRNTKAVDVVNELTDFGTKVTIYDPCANPEELKEEYNLVSQKNLPQKKFDAIVLTVSHKEFENLDLKALKKEHTIVYDVKNFFNPKEVNKTL